MTERTYRCLNCLDHVLTRSFDVPYVSKTCPNCDSFERFVNGIVLDQFEALEASPPEELDWERLDRREKLVVSERLTREGYSLEDFSVEGPDEEAPTPTAAGGEEDGSAAAGDESASADGEDTAGSE